jgi:starch synthase (maltosyl-transferring)
LAPIGRIPVVGVLPSVDGGTRPAKSVVDEQFWIEARVFREGHDAVNATAVLTDPDGVDHPYPMTCANVGLSLWNVQVSADRTGWWSYRVEGWSDPWETWVHDGTIKIEAGIDDRAHARRRRSGHRARHHRPGRGRSGQRPRRAS